MLKLFRFVVIGLVIIVIAYLSLIQFSQSLPKKATPNPSQLTVTTVTFEVPTLIIKSKVKP